MAAVYAVLEPCTCLIIYEFDLFWLKSNGYLSKKIEVFKN